MTWLQQAIEQRGWRPLRALLAGCDECGRALDHGEPLVTEGPQGRPLCLSCGEAAAERMYAEMDEDAQRVRMGDRL